MNAANIINYRLYNQQIADTHFYDPSAGISRDNPVLTGASYWTA